MLHDRHKTLSLIYCCAPEDYDNCKILDNHLSALKTSRWVETWSAKDLIPGYDIQHEYTKRLQSADIILLLISPDFIASELCQEKVQFALQMHEQKRILIIPVLLRPVAWQGLAFSHLQPLPTNAVSVTMWAHLDEAFEHVALGIHRVVEALRRHIVILASVHDHVSASRLQRDLEAQGKLVWYQPTSFTQSTTVDEEAILLAIRSASSVLFLASPDAPYSQILVRSLSFATKLLRRHIIAVWVTGEEWKTSAPLDWKQEGSIDAREEYYGQALSLIHSQILEAISLSSLSVPEIAEISPSFEPRNPYKGLKAFQLEDKRDFFGREHVVSNLVSIVQQSIQPAQVGTTQTRLVAIIGPSGSGKSSVAMAGLLPALQAGAIPGSQKWIYLDPIFPGVHPLETLAVTLSKKLQRSSLSILKDLQSDSTRALQLLAAEIAPTPDTYVVLLIDQFEELFTLTEMEAERQQYIQQLVVATTEQRGSLLVLVTLRADFYDRPMQYQELYQLIQKHQQSVLPIDIYHLRQTIEGPAMLPDVQLHFEGDLVGNLLFETHGQVGALPLLQFALLQLFERREGRQLTMKAYQEIGGVKGALAQHAETIYSLLPSDEHKQLARALFLRLVDAGTLSQDATKRRISLSELVLSNQRATRRLETIWQKFTAERLLTTDTIAEVHTIELSHEALIIAWERLSHWLQEAYEDAHLQDTIRKDAAEWIRHKESVDHLYRGEQLAEALAWRTRNIPSRNEDDFIEVSIIQQKKERQGITRRNVLIGAIGISITLAGLAGGDLYQRRFSPAQTLSLQSQPITLPISYKGHSGGVKSVAWSPDGQHIASSGVDHTVQVWTASSGALLRTYKGHTFSVYGVAWSPDGQRIASSGTDDTVQVWTASSGALLRTYKGHTSYVKSVAWAPDGQRIASAGDHGDGTVQVWAASFGTLLRTYKGHIGGVYSVAWAPDGQRIASAGEDGTVQVWTANSGALLRTYKGHTSYVNSVAWTSDSQRIASAGEDGTVQVWTASSGVLLETYKGHTFSVKSVAWAPDGQRIASASIDHTVQVWTASSGVLLETYKGHTDSVNSVAWAPDGQRIASASDDGTAQEWLFTFTNALRIYSNHTNIVKSVVWAPDGQRIASASIDGTVQVWIASSGTLLQTYKGHIGGVYSVAWAPDGQRIASAGEDGTVQVWTASFGTLLRTYKGHIGGGVYSVAWAPDGQRIASVGNDDIQVWTASSGALLRTYKGHTDVVLSVAWAPDGQRIASSGKDVQVWTASSGTLLRTYKGHIGGVYSVAWSPDGQRVVSASYDIQVWIASSGVLLETYKVHTSPVNSVAWSPDGQRIASANYDHTVQVWTASSGALLETYKGHINRVNSVAWSPDGQRIASASDDHTVQVWTTY